jgi:hypothetical protein
VTPPVPAIQAAAHCLASRCCNVHEASTSYLLVRVVHYYMHTTYLFGAEHSKQCKVKQQHIQHAHVNACVMHLWNWSHYL